jgi:hypothetical protein
MDEKRKALVDAVRKDVRPFILWLGFEPDRRSPEERSWRWQRGAFLRRRELHLDELSIQWERRGRPRFIINFWTSQTERMEVALRPSRYFKRNLENLAQIYPSKDTGWLAWPPWYGRDSIAETVRVARARLVELDLFLRTGAPTTHLDWQIRRVDRLRQVPTRRGKYWW